MPCNDVCQWDCLQTYYLHMTDGFFLKHIKLEGEAESHSGLQLGPFAVHVWNGAANCPIMLLGATADLTG